jgi:outer membrane receptor protein involved in Fe transport
MSFRFKAASRLLAGAAMLAVALPLHAQPSVGEEGDKGADDPADAGGGSQSKDGEAIVVTGSRIRGARATSEVVTLDREEIVAAGQVDLGEAVRALPQNFSGGQNPAIGTGAGFANANVNSASSANLRGLGPDATLTLLNGRRLPYDSAFGGVDISAIPLAALDRIEVLPDGASALYGSDAVAGVVNVVLRRDVSGLTTSAQLGASTGGGYVREQADLVGGERWNGGGFLLAYDFSYNTRIAASDRSYAASLDPDRSLYPSQHRHAAVVSAHQQLGDAVEVSVDALYSRRTSRTVGGTAEARYIADPRVESYAVTPSLKAAIGRAWEIRAFGVLGRDRTRYLTTFVPQAGPASATSGCFCNTIASLELGAEGPLFALPGGEARLAAGGGYRRNGLAYTRFIDGADAGAFDVARRSRYGFGELYLPFVSPANHVAGIDELTLSAAVRYEDYPGLAQIATPRVGLAYAPVAGLHLRASWSRSFKAPTLYQQFTPYQAYLLPAAAFGAGPAPNTVLYASGGNPDLRPERARSWTAGFDLRPLAVPQLRVSATWYDIRYRDRVVQPIAGSIAAAFGDPGYATLIDFAPDAGALAALVSGAQLGLQNFTGAPYLPGDVAAFVDNRNLNVAVQAIHGIDGHVGWSSALPEGRRVDLDLAGSWLESSQRITSALPAIQLAGTVFNPPKFRLRATGGLAGRTWRVSSALNVVGALVDRRFAGEARIGGHATIDLSGSVDLIGGRGEDPGLTLSLAVQNLFDDKPTVIGVTGPTDTPYDSTNFSPIGRFVAVSVRRHW